LKKRTLVPTRMRASVVSSVEHLCSATFFKASPNNILLFRTKINYSMKLATGSTPR